MLNEADSFLTEVETEPIIAVDRIIIINNGEDHVRITYRISQSSIIRSIEGGGGYDNSYGNPSQRSYYDNNNRGRGGSNQNYRGKTKDFLN